MPSWIQPFYIKLWFKQVQSDSNSFNVTQLHDGSILNSAILESAIFHKTLNQTSSMWLKLIYCQSTWWWQPFWILPCWIQPFCTKLWLKLVQSESNSFFLTQLMMAAILNSAMLDSAILHKTLNQTSSIWLKLILCLSTPSWQPSWIVPSWIQPFCTKLWIKLVQSDSNSFIVTQLDDGSHLEFCHVGFRHCHLGLRYLVIFSQIHSKTLFLYSEPDSN